MKEKFREWIGSEGTLMLAGRNAQNNEELVKQAEKKEFLLHTEKPGSPFVNIKKEEPSSQDIYDAALLCAKYSQTWRDSKENVGIHLFKASDVYKDKKMKLGTFGVKKFTKIIAKKGDIKKI
jgi:predicted ribosome quality control (RQC) complex YloA/Tae2 family protein